MCRRQIGRDAEEPTARLVVGADRLEALPGSQKDLLREIMGGVFVARHAPEVVEDRALMCADEQLTIEADRLRHCTVVPRSSLHAILPLRHQAAHNGQPPVPSSRHWPPHRSGPGARRPQSDAYHGNYAHDAYHTHNLSLRFRRPSSERANTARSQITLAIGHIRNRGARAKHVNRSQTISRRRLAAGIRWRLPPTL